MSQAETPPKTVADASIPTPPETAGQAPGDIHAKAEEDADAVEAKFVEGQAKAAKLEEELDKLEKEITPERPEPVHVDQAIGT